MAKPKPIMPVVRELNGYMAVGDIPSCVRCIEENPLVLEFSNSFNKSWFHEAARYGYVDMFDFLISKGQDINFAYGVEKMTPLDAALMANDLQNKYEVTHELIKRGASANKSRALLTPINTSKGPEDEVIKLVQLLVEEGGADVNRVYDIYGNPDNTFTALEFAESHGRSKIVEYLKSKGAIER